MDRERDREDFLGDVGPFREFDGDRAGELSREPLGDLGDLRRSDPSGDLEASREPTDDLECDLDLPVRLLLSGETERAGELEALLCDRDFDLERDLDCRSTLFLNGESSRPWFLELVVDRTESGEPG